MQNSYLQPLEHLPQLAHATEDPALQTVFSGHHASKYHPFRSALQCSADVGLGGRCLLLNSQKYTVSFLAFCHSPSSITTTFHPTFYKGFFQALPLSFLPFTVRLLERALSSLCGSSTTCNLASAFILLNWLFLRSPVTLLSSDSFSGIFFLDLSDVYRTSLLTLLLFF